MPKKHRVFLKTCCRFLGAVVVTLSITIGSSASADQVRPSGRVRDHVTVHEQPRSQSDVIGRLNVGESATLIGDRSRWHQIRLDTGTAGFVSKSWTKVIRQIDDREADELRIHFLNVGAGTCTVVECPGPNAPPMIIDCGSLGGTPNDMNSAEATGYIQTILSKHSARPNLVLSHADRDHYGWISTVLDGIQTQNIWQGGNPDDYTKDEFPTWINAQGANGATLHGRLDDGFHNDEMAMGDAELGCGDASIFVLTANSGKSKNGDSLILEIRYDDFGATFTGDAEKETEASARTNFDENVKTTVLSGSHHGARTKGSNNSAWAKATEPEVVVFSAGRKFGHPQCDAVERFQLYVANGARHATQCGEGSSYEAVRNTRQAIYMTEINGTVVVTSSGASPLSLFCSGSNSCSSQIDHP